MSFIACNDLGEGASNATAAFLFQTLMDSQQIGRHESEIIRRLVGPFPQSYASQACKIVQQLVQLIPQQHIDNLRNRDNKVSPNQESRIEFGQGIKFTFVDLHQQDDEYNHGKCNSYISFK